MFGKSGYQKLAGDDPDKPNIPTEGRAIITYPIPASIGLYSDDGLEYTDIMRNNILIRVEKLPDFLHNIRLAEAPWTQHAFASIFYNAERQPMPGFDQFEQFLQKNPTAHANMAFIMLKARSAQIQIATVGSHPNALLCQDSQDLITLTHKLSDMFQDFQDRVNKIAKMRYQNRDKLMKDLEKTFRADWEAALQPYIQKYQQDWDTQNLLLNLLAIASIAGLVGLICKNIARAYQGKSLSLFQFDAARSKSLEMLEQFKTIGLPYPSQEAQNFFSENREDALQTIQELKKYVERLHHEIEQHEKPKTKKSYAPLHALHHWLAKAIEDFSIEIKKFQDTKDEVNQREVAEAIFINQWHESLQALLIEAQYTVYPEAVQAVVADLAYLAGQLNNEFHSAPRFALYSSRSKP